MSDIYGAFANAAVQNYIQKADPRTFFNFGTTKNDLEQAAPSD